MLIEIQNKINRLKEAKAWLQTHLNADELVFSQLFPDVIQMIKEKTKEEVSAVQFVKEAPSSFVSFN